MYTHLELLKTIPQNIDLEVFAQMHSFLKRYKLDLAKLNLQDRIKFLLKYFGGAAKWIQDIGRPFSEVDLVLDYYLDKYYRNRCCIVVANQTKAKEIKNTINGFSEIEIIEDPKLIDGHQLFEIKNGKVIDSSVLNKYNIINSMITKEEYFNDQIKAENFDEEIIKKDLEKMINKHQVTYKSFGTVTSCSDGILVIEGLRKAKMGEWLEIKGHNAIVVNIKSEDELIAIYLDNYEDIVAGEKVFATNKFLEAPCGPGVFGRILDALGNPIDGKGPLINVKFKNLYPAPSIFARQSVNRPYHTGIKVIDMLVPIGRGQRELILGDRGVGKTTIALDSMIHNARINSGVYSIYVAIGQRLDFIKQVVASLEKHNAMHNSVIIAAEASNAAALKYIAPWIGAIIGQDVMYSGGDALIVYDDLSKHAQAYRQLSLLQSKSPGREAFPGDMFFQHSSLLELGGNLSKKYGGGSLTVLPIIETQAEDVTAYIPTNVISITDGQIVLDSQAFQSGTRPAINLGLSVSRVGSAAQLKAARASAGSTKIELAQYKELRSFTQFSSNLDDITANTLKKGEMISKLLKQGAAIPIMQEKQCLLFAAAKAGCFRDIENLEVAEKIFLEMLEIHFDSLLDSISKNNPITENELNKVIDMFKVKISESE